MREGKGRSLGSLGQAGLRSLALLTLLAGSAHCVSSADPAPSSSQAPHGGRDAAAAASPLAPAAQSTQGGAPAPTETTPPRGGWSPFAAPMPGAKEAAASDALRWTSFTALERGGWRCTSGRCEVLDGAGEQLRTVELPCSPGQSFVHSPERRFGAVLCGDELTVFSFTEETRWKLSTAAHVLRTVLVDDDGTVMLSVEPHGTLLRIDRARQTTRLELRAPPGHPAPSPRAYVAALHAPWLAMSVDRMGGQLLWARDSPAAPRVIDEHVLFNGPRCWSVSRAGEAWRVDPSGRTKLSAELEIPSWGGDPVSRTEAWGRTGLILYDEAGRIELRGPELELRDRFDAPFAGLVESNPRGDRIYVIDPRDGRIDVRGVDPPPEG